MRAVGRAHGCQVRSGREARHGVARRVRRTEAVVIAPVAANPERVVATELARQEVVGVHRHAVGRTDVHRLAVVRRRAAVRARGHDEVRLQADDARGRRLRRVRRIVVVQNEVVADVGVLHVHEQAIADYVLVAELVGRRRAGGPQVGAVGARHRVLTNGRFDRRQIARVTRVALLGGEQAVQGQLVALEHLHFRLQVRRLQRCEVGVQTVVHSADRVRERVARLVRLDLLALGRRLVEANDTDADGLLAERAPDPGLALLDRAAGFDAVVLDVLNRVARARALLADLVGDVVRFEVVVRIVEARRTAEPVGACLCDEVDADAAGLLRHVNAAGVDGHFLEHVEVEIGRRGTGGREVGDVDAVKRPLVVGRVAAARHVVGLLTRHVAADIFAVHGDAGGLLKDDPGIARRRNALQQLVGERLLGPDFLGVDNRALAGDGDRLLHCRDG